MVYRAAARPCHVKSPPQRGEKPRERLPRVTAACWRNAAPARRALGAILLGLALLPCTASGSGMEAAVAHGTAWHPEPFSASYSVRYSILPFSVTGMRSLQRQDDKWLLRSELKALVASIGQETLLNGGPGGRMQPLRYSYWQRGVAGRRDRILDFDRERGLVLRSGDKLRQQPLLEPAWDPLSWQLALRRDLSAGDQTPGSRYRYRITDGGEYKEYDFELVERVEVQVPAGDFEALLLERRFDESERRLTRVWLAPALDYLLVRLELADDDGATLHLALKTPPRAAAAPEQP